MKRVTDFFLGLNAGRWLQIRMNEITGKSGKWLDIEEGSQDIEEGEERVGKLQREIKDSRSQDIEEGEETCIDDRTTMDSMDSMDSTASTDSMDSTASTDSMEDLLVGTGLELIACVQEPPEDASYLFEYWGMSNNSALPNDLPSMDGSALNKLTSNTDISIERPVSKL